MPATDNLRRFAASVLRAGAWMLLLSIPLRETSAAPIQQAYVKASNTGAGDEFGTSVAISGDLLVIGAPGEDSNGTLADDTVSSSGAAYVYRRNGGAWQLQAYLKSGTPRANDRFGYSVAISGDTIVVGVNGDDGGGATDSGAVYIFVWDGVHWAQQAYLKAGNAGAGDAFGTTVAISGDTVVVGAAGEDGNGSSPTNESASGAGAAYIFVRSGTQWSQQGYLKASNAEAGDQFGFAVGISGDTVVVGATQEDSAAIGVNGSQGNASAATNSGAAYLFTRSGTVWSQQAYLKASNTGAGDQFGFSVSVHGDTVAVSAPREDSGAAGVGGSETSNAQSDSGAVYLFRRQGSAWNQTAYIKASNTGANDQFGQSVSLSGDILVVGAWAEDSNALGIDGSQANNIAANSGAAYAFGRVDGVWSQQSYLKADNTDPGDQFGRAVAISGRTAVIGANAEGSNATGINGNGANNSAASSGAAYVIHGVGPAVDEPDLDVEQPLGVLLADDGSTASFGVPGPSGNIERTFTLLNRGLVTLTLASIITSGGQAGEFVVDTSATASSIAAGASTTVKVTFIPGGTGTRTTTLMIDSNDPDEDFYEITLTGDVVPEIAVGGNGVNLADGDSTPAALDHTDFGRAEVAGGTVTRVFQISNVGAADLILGTATIAGAHAADFEVTQQPAATVAPGASTTLEVRFDPAALGQRSATVGFPTNDGNENPFGFSIHGIGSGPGLPDSAFGNSGFVTTTLGNGDSRAYKVTLQGDGKLVVAGYAAGASGSDFALVRYLSDGNADSSFGSAGKQMTDVGGSDDQCRGVAWQPDGKIVAAGFAFGGSKQNVAVVRYLSNGTLDSSFGSGGRAMTAAGPSDDLAEAVALQSDGKIVVAGASHRGSDADILLVRYLADGSLDTGFGVGGIVVTQVGAGDDEAHAVAIQRDGRIIVSGSAVNAGGVRDMVLVRYLPDGSLDPGFGDHGKVVTSIGAGNSVAHGLAVQGNGQIIVCGYTENGSGTSFALARYLREGLLDSTFGVGGKVITAIGAGHDEANDVTVQADGGLFVAGFSRDGSDADFALARYLPDGRLDLNFAGSGRVITAISGGDDVARSVVVQPDGKVVIAGSARIGSREGIALARYEASPVRLPVLVVEQPANEPLRNGGSDRDFGAIQVNMTGAPLPFTLMNDGTEVLTVTGVHVSGGKAGDFLVDTSGMSASLAPGASTVFTVAFRPTAIGVRGTTLQIHTQSGQSPFQVSLFGIGRNTIAENWRLLHFGSPDNKGSAAMSADPDGDGQVNLVEFAFGTDPKASGSAPVAANGSTISPGSPTVLIRHTSNGAEIQALFSRRKDYEAAGLSYTVQFSSDLATWASSTAVPAIVADDGMLQVVSVPYPFFVDGRKGHFFRVLVGGL